MFPPESPELVLNFLLRALLGFPLCYSSFLAPCILLAWPYSGSLTVIGPPITLETKRKTKPKTKPKTKLKTKPRNEIQNEAQNETQNETRQQKPKRKRNPKQNLKQRPEKVP